MALIFWAEKADDRRIRQECEQNSDHKINWLQPLLITSSTAH